MLAFQVEEEDAREYAREIGAMYIETSAMADTNVKQLFTDIAMRLPDESADGEEGVDLSDGRGGKASGGGCAC